MQSAHSSLQLVGLSILLLTTYVLSGCVAPGPITLDLGHGVILETAYVPKGEFLMGSKLSPAEWNSDEHPRHPVFVDPFYMGRFEVTVSQFQRFVDETGYLTDAERGTAVPEKAQMKDGSHGGYTVDADGNWVLNKDITWRDPGFPQSKNHPVVLISWNDARAFCDWLSNTSLRRVRLPSETEWEYACRGGTTTLYWWGDDPNTSEPMANLADQQAQRKYAIWREWGLDFLRIDDGFIHTAPVGTYPANPFGLHDMIGNVWEWCEDIKQPNYEGAPVDGSPWLKPQQEEQRVFRGGCWGNGARGGRCSWRAGHSASFRGSDFGFRIVVEATNE